MENPLANIQPVCSTNPLLNQPDQQSDGEGEGDGDYEDEDDE